MIAKSGIKLPILLIILNCMNYCSLQANTEPDQLISVKDCKQCHECEKPTAGNPCLRKCPSIEKAYSISEHKLSEAPDTIILDYIVDQYQPVRFDHKSHAKMAQMNLKCSTCHHFSPKGQIPPCRKCHGGQANPNNLRQPALKGAYHRQCMGCHREWSHDTKCVVCHKSCEDDNFSKSVTDPTDIVGISHPVITVPTSKIYHTPYEPGPIVTFYHDEHVDLFEFQCVDCHVKENCSYCHDLTDPKSKMKTVEEKHKICTECHLKDNCSHCHDKKQKPTFNHASTGWPLSQYHDKLHCRSCHPTGKKIAKLDNTCNSCHSGWNQQNFRHTVTGLMLNDIHMEADCRDCHTNRDYSKSECSGCHDDEITLENGLPGRYVIQR